MSGLAKILVFMAAAAFVLAAVGNLFTGRMLGVTPEGLSRACTNLALLAIGFSVVFEGRPTDG